MGRPGDCNVVKRKDNYRRKEDNKVDQLSHTAELAVNADHADSDSFLWFESRKEIFNGIMESFKDDNIRGVGLYGMGGSGKTTFAIQLGKRAKELGIFNLVVFVCVDAFPDVKRIQHDIADRLNLIMTEADSNLMRSQIILLTLKKYQSVLVILDDLWAPLNLDEIGIWKGCKLLITSRNQNIGQGMGIERRFALYLSTDLEAFDLLRKRAGLVDGSPKDITDIAMEIAKRCQGLPIAISVVASALRGKSIDHWQQALAKLNKANMDSEDKFQTIQRILNLSVNSVMSNNVAAKTLFSICGLFPLDQEIDIQDLSLFAAKLGLCSKNEAIAAVNTLKDSSLLMQAAGSSDRVIMHDLIRDMALNLVSKEKPGHKDSIEEYLDELNDDEDFQWKQELEALVLKLYGKTEHSPSSSSFFENPGVQIVSSNPYIASSGAAATIPKPSGKMVNLKEGGCVVDKSFLPLLKQACKENPQLLGSQRTHSEFLRQTAFDNLGKLLFLLHNVVLKDWVHHKQELQFFWKQTLAMEFDLDWLKPIIERIFSSPEFQRIEALREEERQRNEEAARLRRMLEVIENKTAVIRIDIEREESMLNGFAIAPVSNAQELLHRPWRAELALIQRIANRVADALAKYVVKQRQLVRWNGKSPPHCNFNIKDAYTQYAMYAVACEYCPLKKAISRFCPVASSAMVQRPCPEKRN
ncbi:hypothetical protein PIB30_013323 [Stylosanthes scabra]|uniref:NB-ARC domain-containing protein n=1 Tax=Stylosanthes scabra TaxID=79078 RepID=A0ABU6U5A3_9FABA|nr:hypothetical protein [Stylosanthes scabra]